ncbi:hypothetical protein CGCA056_v006435 [Colletotrichum aenigma]|uniref:uncharacterized protein n=1 Tax=Colletotrichum aenigma TaxID=1215731 RepID=UPI001872E94C|nr:uncharacterized protein CGCA056_v006435 [Colletotrichum aenigma]KAF5521450.1 hypothetical protein CGCA056_v006435 [Colletotrichum aenigma]
MFGTTEPYTSQSSSETPGQHPSQPDDSFTDLVSVGLFEQQPPPELIVFLTNVYFDKWYFAAPMFQRARYSMSLHLPPHMRPPMCLQYIVMALGADITKTHRKLAIQFYQRARAYMQADEMRIHTRLPASDKAFEAGLEELTSPTTSILHQEGQNFSSFAGRVLASSLFYQAFQQSSQNIPDEEAQDVKTSLHWKRHREIDNDLASLLNCLPDDLKLPKTTQQAALSTIERVGTPHHMIRQCRIRLVAAAEEILNILRMMPDVNDMLKNPTLTFSMYTYYQRQDNLDFTPRLMILAAKTWGNPVTRSMAIQLAVDMRQRGLDSAAVEKASELPLERSTVPILAKGDNDSSNFLFQLNNFENSPEPTADT